MSTKHEPGTSGETIGDLIYSVEVTVAPSNDNAQGETETAAADRPPAPATRVRYCDICRRWGLAGSRHVCWRNWRHRLSDLLTELALDGQL
jgi:hypothetical protein